MLRYDRQTKPGLVALYDIRPGNAAGPFLQPRSPHGASAFIQVFSSFCEHSNFLPVSIFYGTQYTNMASTCHPGDAQRYHIC